MNSDIWAYVVAVESEDACNPVDPPPKDDLKAYLNDQYKWFALVKEDFLKCRLIDRVFLCFLKLIFSSVFLLNSNFNPVLRFSKLSFKIQNIKNANYDGMIVYIEASSHLRAQRSIFRWYFQSFFWQSNF